MFNCTGAMSNPCSILESRSSLRSSSLRSPALPAVGTPMNIPASINPAHASDAPAIETLSRDFTGISFPIPPVGDHLPRAECLEGQLVRILPLRLCPSQRPAHCSCSPCLCKFSECAPAPEECGRSLVGRHGVLLISGAAAGGLVQIGQPVQKDNWLLPSHSFSFKV